MGDSSVPRALVRLARPVFTTREVAATRGGSMSATSQALDRMRRDGLVVRVTRGIWCTPSDPGFTPFSLAAPLAGSHRAYVSFLTALHLHGVVEQIPQVIYVATTGHTRVVATPVGTFSFHRIDPAFFDGFAWHGEAQRYLLATPEKALVDCLYISGRKGRRFAHFPELDLSRFDRRLAQDWVTRIADPRLRTYVEGALAALLRSYPPPRRRARS